MADTVNVDGSPVGTTMGYPSLESCAFTWLFDTGQRRFRRVPRGVAPELVGARDEWVLYERVEVQPERSCFVVTLDGGGTRILRSWLHVEGCEHCRSVRPEGADPAGAVESLRAETTRPVPRPRPFGGHGRPDGPGWEPTDPPK